MNKKAFTLLEVLVALVIFSTTFVLLIELETRYIKKVSKNREKLKALHFFKKKEFGLTNEEEGYKIKTESKNLDSLIIYENSITDNKGKEILVIKSYETNLKSFKTDDNLFKP